MKNDAQVDSKYSDDQGSGRVMAALEKVAGLWFGLVALVALTFITPLLNYLAGSFSVEAAIVWMLLGSLVLLMTLRAWWKARWARRLKRSNGASQPEIDLFAVQAIGLNGSLKGTFLLKLEPANLVFQGEQSRTEISQLAIKSVRLEERRGFRADSVVLEMAPDSSIGLVPLREDAVIPAGAREALRLAEAIRSLR